MQIYDFHFYIRITSFTLLDETVHVSINKLEEVPDKFNAFWKADVLEKYNGKKDVLMVNTGSEKRFISLYLPDEVWFEKSNNDRIIPQKVMECYIKYVDSKKEG